MPRLHRWERRRLNVYDAFSIGQDATYPMPLLDRGWLFGNRHIGDFRHCNLLVPGSLVGEARAYIEHWYARTDIVEGFLSKRQQARLHEFASRTVTTFRLGDQPQHGWQRPLSELLAARPWEPETIGDRQPTPEPLAQAAFDRMAQREREGVAPISVPPRQNLCVTVETDRGAIERLEADLDGLIITCWIHLEGRMYVSAQ